MAIRTRRAILLAFALVALGATVAHAHPYGQRPVAFFNRSAEGVNLRWVAAPDEFTWIGDHLRFGPLSPQAMAEREEFKAYFLEHISIESGGEVCEGEVHGAAGDPAGFVVVLTFDCGGPVDEALVRFTLLQDIDDRYTNLVYATTDGDPVRGAFTNAVGEMTIDFVRAQGEVAGEEGSDESLHARIVAALQGIDGSTSLFFILVFAFALGALHGFQPGHGKAIAAAYLVGSGGTMRQALTLGGIVTFTHAISTGLIAAIPITLGQAQPPSALSGWLEIFAGILILAMGVFLLRRPFHSHDHGHLDPQARAAMPMRRLAGIGFVGGLVPNPEALFIVLLAFSLDRWTAGAALVIAFSVGLGAVVLGVAIAAVKGGGVMRRVGGSRMATLAPRVAAGIFLIMGVIVATRGAVSL